MALGRQFFGHVTIDGAIRRHDRERARCRTRALAGHIGTENAEWSGTRSPQNPLGANITVALRAQLWQRGLVAVIVLVVWRP